MKKPKPAFHGNTVLACCGEEDMNAYSSTEDDGYTSIGVIDWSKQYYKEPPDPFPRTTFTIWRWQDGNLKTLYCYSMKRFDSHRYRDSKKIISYIAHTFRDFEVRKIIANHRCGMFLSSQVKGLMPCGTEIISYQFRDMPVAVYWDGETFNIDWTMALDDLGQALKNHTVVFPKRCRLIEYYLSDFQQFVAFQDRKGRRQYSYLRTGPYGFVECAQIALSVIPRLHQRRDCEPDWETLKTIVEFNRK